MKDMIRFIGLDVHKDFISVAIAEEGGGAIESYGEIVNTPVAVSKLARCLSRDGHDLCFVYEAGCFGFVLYRQLTKLGHSCVVAAPSLIPRQLMAALGLVPSEHSSGNNRHQVRINCFPECPS